MRAGLAQNEPKILEFWQNSAIYEKLQENRKGKNQFILHDGPPYSNGAIHMGQALNKLLKDITVKYRSLAGMDAPFVPGWDTHGLPNELATIKKHKLNPRTVDPVELREKCKEHALHYLEIQKEQFVRLGVQGYWDRPYITLNPEYEAAIVRVFGKMARKGMVYRGLKPVHWCPTCVTALAEAEIEYKDKKSHSVYVKFPFDEDGRKFFPQWDGPIHMLIWTTTPWTLPGNMAVALNPEAEYVLVTHNGEGLVMAKELIPAMASATGLDNYEIIGSVKGKEMEGAKALHPFLDRQSPVVLADYVVLDDAEAGGTGAVHTAPGHGREDYETGLRYNLKIVVPVDDGGYLTEEAGPFSGLKYDEANQKIIAWLSEKGLLLSSGEKEHSYPHCWRCRGPVIFRATKQWFVAADADELRRKALEAIDETRFIPAWGHDRIYNMVADRPDWCISRQRIWGTPIPAVFCDGCGEVLFGEEVTGAVEKLFAREGSDSWYIRDIGEILPAGFTCPCCGGSSFTKEMDIFDVWFESGVSHEVVMGPGTGLHWPADLYLEGGDQHRGWFQVSLLTAIATRDQAPFKSVLTHGWVLDGKGHPMHKSLGNVIDPMDMIKKFGAEILRLFIASVDYTADMRITEDALKQVSEVYKKIRNSCRFLLGNLYDYDHEKNRVAPENMQPIDRWILQKKNELLRKLKEAYDNYQFHIVYYYLQSFCSTELSSVYMDVVKDRLYTSAADSPERRSAQSAMYETLLDLTKAMYPVLSFTTEEIWQNFFVGKEEGESVMLAIWPEKTPDILSEEEQKTWNFFTRLRDEAYAMLEEMRQDKKIKQSLEARIDIWCDGEYFEMLHAAGEDLRQFFIVSQLEVHRAPAPVYAAPTSFEGISLMAEQAKGEKCTRCWNYSEDPMNDETYPEACPRCRKALSANERK